MVCRNVWKHVTISRFIGTPIPLLKLPAFVTILLTVHFGWMLCHLSEARNTVVRLLVVTGDKEDLPDNCSGMVVLQE